MLLTRLSFSVMWSLSQKDLVSASAFQHSVDSESQQLGFRKFFLFIIIYIVVNHDICARVLGHAHDDRGAGAQSQKRGACAQKCFWVLYTIWK